MRTRFASLLRRSLVLGAVAAVSALSAAAQNITYTFTGVGSGTLGAQSFASTGFSFSVTVPTASVDPAAFGVGTPGVKNLVMNFTINTVGSGTVSGAYVFNNKSAGVVGFGNTAKSDLINLRGLPGMATYDLVTAYGPQTATGSNLFFSQFINLATSAGALTMSSVATATFAATTGTPSDPGVIPEPSTYALLGTGLIALGGIARRRRNNV